MADNLPRAKQSQTKFYLDPKLKQEYQEILKARKKSMNRELERFIREEIRKYRKEQEKKLLLGGENIEN